MNSKVLISKEEFCCILLLFITLLLFADGITRPISTSPVIHLQFVTKNDMDNTIGALACIYGSADGITRSIPARHIIHLQFVMKNGISVLSMALPMVLRVQYLHDTLSIFSSL
eukprot:689334_1